MIELNLDALQAQILRSADDGVLMRDPTGVVVGTGHRLAWKPEQIEELEKRLDGDITDEDIAVFKEYRKKRGKPRKLYSTEEVLSHLDSMTER